MRRLTELRDGFTPIAPDDPRQEAALVLTGTQFRRLTATVVYAWFRRGRPLYVGMSSRGLHRLTKPQHESMGPRFVRRCDSIYLWTCDSHEQATALEYRLIRLWRPKLNIRDNHDEVTIDPWSGPRGVPYFRSAIWARLRGAETP